MGFFRTIATLASFAALTLIAAPSAQAGGADGTYRLTKVTGTFVANGQTVSVPKDILKNALLRDGRIIVRDNKIPIYRSKWEQLMDQFSYAGFTGTVNVSGPSNLTLKPVDGTFVGKTTTPVKLSVSGDYMGTPINMTMSMTFKGKVVGNTMTITVPVTINAMGMSIMTGTIKMVATRG